MTIDDIKTRMVEYLKRSIPAFSLGKRLERQQRGSLRASIDLKCLDCSGGYRREVKYCPAVNCPLWLVRPYQTTEANNLILHELETGTLGTTVITGKESL